MGAPQRSSSLTSMPAGIRASDKAGDLSSETSSKKKANSILNTRGIDFLFLFFQVNIIIIGFIFYLLALLRLPFVFRSAAADVHMEKLTRELESLAWQLDDAQREKDLQRLEINRLRKQLMSTGSTMYNFCIILIILINLDYFILLS